MLLIFAYWTPLIIAVLEVSCFRQKVGYEMCLTIILSVNYDAGSGVNYDNGSANYDTDTVVNCDNGSANYDTDTVVNCETSC